MPPLNARLMFFTQKMQQNIWILSTSDQILLCRAPYVLDESVFYDFDLFIYVLG